jgi:dethiobiotin synthetase/adenosylmethionine--8-amino-7-oxononanoate aminotransferase
VVRRSAGLFGPPATLISSNDPASWTGLPIIFDEVFTGIYRLGSFSASSFLDVKPDISVHAKLLTAGVVPLCATLASECIFRAFESDDKTDALLHGHSYTAHPVGCQVALESVRQMRDMEKSGAWDWAKRDGWSTEVTGLGRENVWSIWSYSFVQRLSCQKEKVDGVWALGSVLAIHMKAIDGAGYNSAAASRLRDTMWKGVDEHDAWNIHSRVLGNVLYLMGGQRMNKEEARDVEEVVERALALV